ncbi:MAG: PadR family transcriptional regulator [Promethearchaeota archaeon]
MNTSNNKETTKITLEIDNIANNIIKSMKKGYINTLILLALGKEPSHGYNLMQKIREESYGAWNPTASSLYPHLSSLTDNELIKFTIEMDGKRERKVYEITEKGKKTLKVLLKKQQSMTNSLHSMVIFNLKKPNYSIIDHFQGFFDSDWLDDITLDNKKKKDRFAILSRRKQVLSFLINKLENLADDLDKEIVSLKGKRTLSWL